jgi:NitT/TauT family transport system substrate-binding protein
LAGLPSGSQVEEEQMAQQAEKRSKGRVAQLGATLMAMLFAAACSSTPAATNGPTKAPTSAPTVAPTTAPTSAPTVAPTVAPTATPVAGALPAPEKTSIRIGSNAISANNFPVKFALDAGFYKKHGLDAEVTVFEGTQSTTALVAGQIDILRGEDQAVFFSQRTAVPLVLLASFYGKFLDNLVVSKDIKTGADLKGKKVGTNTFGGQSHREAVVSLQSLGLTVDDVELVAVGGQSARLAALESGAVAGTLMDTSAAADMEAKGFVSLVKLGELPNKQALGPIITSKKFAAENPNTVLAVTAAMLDALQLMYTDKPRAVTALADWEQVLAADAEGELDEFLLAATRDIMFTREGIVELQTFLSLLDPTVKDINPDDTFTLSFLQQLKDLGYYKAAGVPGY